MFQRVLLLGGVLSSLLYVVGIDLVAPVRYPVYHDYADQMVSELFAAGAPTRTLMVWLMIPYNVLVLGLALGVWKSAERSRAVDGGGDRRLWCLQHRRASVLSHGRARHRRIAAGRVAHCRDDRNVDPHRVDDRVGSLRSWKAIPILLVRHDRDRRRVWYLGGVLARPMPRATPGLGIAERVNIYATMLWIATLAASFLRLPTHPGSASRC
jgi:hypothetical protein